MVVLTLLVWAYYGIGKFPDTKCVKKINMKRDTTLAETSHGHIWYYLEESDLCSDVPLSSPLEASPWLSLVLYQAGWPQAETSCGHVCNNFGHIDQMYHPHPHLVEKSHGQAYYYCEQADLQWEVSPHKTTGQVCIWSDVSSGQHHVRCTPYPLTEKAIWTWKDDWPPWVTSTPWKNIYLGG